MHRAPPGDDAVYRGWMLRTEHYTALADALAHRGVTLSTSAEQYQCVRELPGWHAALADDPPGAEPVDLARPADGGWRVIELGDGQVSDRPAAISPVDLLTALSGVRPTPDPPRPI